MHGSMNGCRYLCMDGWIANEYVGMNEIQQVWMKWRDLLSRQDEKTFLSFSRPQKYIFLIFKVFYVSNGKKCLLASFFSVSDAIFFYDFTVFTETLQPHHFVWCICWLLLLGSGPSPGHQGFMFVKRRVHQIFIFWSLDSLYIHSEDLKFFFSFDPKV